jgi:hypothetical protein
LEPPPTYYALKPQGSDSSLLIRTPGQEIPREIRVPDGANIHEIAAGVLNCLGPRKYHQVSVRHHIGVSVFKLMAEGAANPKRLTKRELTIKGKYDRIGWEIPFEAEEPDPILPYGYWIDRSGTLIPVNKAGGHETVAAALVGGSAAAVREGYFRVVMDIANRTIHFEVAVTRISPTLNQISTLATLARNHDWRLFDATIGGWVNLSLSQHDIVEWLKSTHSFMSHPRCNVLLFLPHGIGIDSRGGQLSVTNPFLLHVESDALANSRHTKAVP